MFVDLWSLGCTLITLGTSVHSHNLSSYSGTWTADVVSLSLTLRLSVSFPRASFPASYRRRSV